MYVDKVLQLWHKLPFEIAVVRLTLHSRTLAPRLSRAALEGTPPHSSHKPVNTTHVHVCCSFVHAFPSPLRDSPRIKKGPRTRALFQCDLQARAGSSASCNACPIPPSHKFTTARLSECTSYANPRLHERSTRRCDHNLIILNV